MLKLLVIFLVGFMLIFAVVPGYNSFADKPDNTGKSVIPIPPGKDKIKELFLQPDGTFVERTTHIFYVDGATHKGKEHGKPGGGGDDGGKGGGNGGSKGKKDPTASCFTFLEQGMRWQSTEPFVVNPTNSGLDSSFVVNTMNTSTETWDQETSFDIFGTGYEDTSALLVLTNVDQKNVVVFGTVVDEDTGEVLTNVIAVTYTWANWGAPKPFKQISEWDMAFNVAAFQFGDESIANPPGQMDLENIATHEFGHAVGLGHTSEPQCFAQTMFPTAPLGETDKRTLEAGDKNGIKKLYK